MINVIFNGLFVSLDVIYGIKMMSLNVLYETDIYNGQNFKNFSVPW